MIKHTSQHWRSQPLHSRPASRIVVSQHRSNHRCRHSSTATVITVRAPSTPITNQVAGNAVAVFARSDDGTLTPAGNFATGGTGTGAGLGSQGAVTLSDDGRLLFAVTAGSNDVSVFRVRSAGTVAGKSYAVRRHAADQRHGLAQRRVCLECGRSGEHHWFHRRLDGGLTQLAGSTRSLSGANVGPAEVSFSPDGGQLVVTEKSTSLLDVFPVDENGVAGALTSNTSAGGTPFGFAFGPRNLLFVSEAAAPGSASSYAVSGSGDVRVISGAVLTHHGAPCWAVVTTDRRFGYTGNGSGSVSGFSIAPNGSIRLLGDGATALIALGVNDIALSANSRYLYVLQTGGARAIHAFRIQNDGSLRALGAVGGLPAGIQGLAAF